MNDQNLQHDREDSNGLGLAGFIVSLVGLVMCGGLICPIGMIMSLIALGKRPKGFAIAGVVLGVIGSLGFFLVFFVFGFAALLALVGVGLAAAAIAVASQIGPNAHQIYQDIESYYDANGQAPAALTAMGTYTPTELTDNWGMPIRYEVSPDGQEVWLRSDGEDKTPGTSDDIEFYRNFQTGDFHFESKGVNIGS